MKSLSTKSSCSRKEAGSSCASFQTKSNRDWVSRAYLAVLQAGELLAVLEHDEPPELGLRADFYVFVELDRPDHLVQVVEVLAGRLEGFFAGVDDQLVCGEREDFDGPVFEVGGQPAAHLLGELGDGFEEQRVEVEAALVGHPGLERDEQLVHRVVARFDLEGDQLGQQLVDRFEGHLREAAFCAVVPGSSRATLLRRASPLLGLPSSGLRTSRSRSVPGSPSRSRASSSGRISASPRLPPPAGFLSGWPAPR